MYFASNVLAAEWWFYVCFRKITIPCFFFSSLLDRLSNSFFPQRQTMMNEELIFYDLWERLDSEQYVRRLL